MNICVFGDSIAWGACDYEKGGWVDRLKMFLLENTDDEVYNLGISGDRLEGVLSRFENEAKARGAGAVIFAVGINDSRYVNQKDNSQTDLKKFENDLMALAELAKKITDKILFVGLTKVDETKTMPIPWDQIKYYSNENIVRFNEITRNMCTEKDCEYIDVFDLLDLSDLEDGLHPNAAGHQKIYEKVLPFIR